MQANEPPPALPVYAQPPCPGPGYLWNPGYWYWGSGGYYWVPGVWVMSPYTGALWTPGWWGFLGGFYRWHHGYWGSHIGFYGGIPYGYGYTGSGYHGGYWDHDRFMYNRSVTNITNVRIVNVYNAPVPRPAVMNRVSYNGGRGGLNVRPTRSEFVAMREPHVRPLPAQVTHRTQAMQNRQSFANVNHGRPPMAVATRPLTVRPIKAAPTVVNPGVHGATRPTPTVGRPGQPGARPATPAPGARPNVARATQYAGAAQRACFTAGQDTQPHAARAPRNANTDGATGTAKPAVSGSPSTGADAHRTGETGSAASAAAAPHSAAAARTPGPAAEAEMRPAPQPHGSVAPLRSRSLHARPRSRGRRCGLLRNRSARHRSRGPRCDPAPQPQREVSRPEPQRAQPREAPREARVTIIRIARSGSIKPASLHEATHETRRRSGSHGCWTKPQIYMDHF